MYSIRQLEAHPTFRAAQDVAQICSSLFDCLYVRDFSYSLVYPDGSRMILCSNRNIVVDQNLHEIFNRMRVRGELWIDFKPFSSMLGYFASDVITIMSECYPRVSAANLVMEDHYLEKYNIVDRLIITTKSALVSENFIFTFEKNMPYKSLLFNKYDLFVKFCHYFKDKACGLIENMADSPIIPAFRNQKIFKNVDDNGSLLLHSRDTFLDKIALKHHFSSCQNKTCLTKKELKYASYIVKGYSAREIGEQCYVSKRTIETHINNIKYKLGVTKKSGLIEKLLDIEI